VFNDRFQPRAMIVGLVALTGAVVMISVNEHGGMMGLGIGEWAAAAATLSYIASTLVTRKSLRDVPMGIFSVYRTIVGAGIYFVLAILIFGPDTFRDLLSPVLWSWIWVYAGVVIVFGQIAWNLALKHASSSDLALATSFSPLAAILIAMLLLGENPGAGLIPGAILIAVAIFIGRMSGANDSRMVDGASASKQARVHSVPGQPCLSSDCHDTTERVANISVRIKKRRQPELLRLAKTTAPPGRQLNVEVG